MIFPIRFWDALQAKPDGSSEDWRSINEITAINSEETMRISWDEFLPPIEYQLQPRRRARPCNRPLILGVRVGEIFNVGWMGLYSKILVTVCRLCLIILNEWFHILSVLFNLNFGRLAPCSMFRIAWDCQEVEVSGNFHDPLGWEVGFLNGWWSRSPETTSCNWECGSTRKWGLKERVYRMLWWGKYGKHVWSPDGMFFFLSQNCQTKPSATEEQSVPLHRPTVDWQKVKPSDTYQVKPQAPNFNVAQSSS